MISLNGVFTLNKLIIKTTNVVKTFGKVVALDELNMFVPKGISGFVGKNGSGKTTTIGVLLGLIRPNSGNATVFGLDCWHDAFEIKRKLGVMHEINAYPGSFSGKRLLEHVAKLYGIAQINSKVDALLKDVGLADAKDKPIKTYSAGMFKRLGLAQALIGEPELAILDEPTANIDPLGRIALLDQIKQLHKEQGTSFLISTHILSDLEKVCNWLSVIEAGKIVDQGNIKDLAEKYSANIYKIEVSNSGLFVENIQKLASVDKIWIENEKIFCKVNNPESFCEEMPKIAIELKLQLKNFQKMLGTIEDIYTQTVVGENKGE